MAHVVEYLLDELAALGVEHVFGVPGDYAFPINDAVTEREDMRWIGCSNELNAAYAADGYARVRGVGVLNTTYGVGELSALNGVAGAYAEHLPVIHLVGMPARTVLDSGRLVHHSLGNGQREAFYEAAGHVVCARTILDGKNCAAELARVLACLKKERRPIYIGIPADSAQEEVVPENALKGDKTGLAFPEDAHCGADIQLDSKQAELVGQVVARIMKALGESSQPCVLPGMIMARFGCREAVRTFLEGTGLPYATMLMDKTILDEQEAGHVGMYCGHMVEPRVAAFVEQADCLLTLGVEWTDFNTGSFTNSLDEARLISLTPEGVRFGKEPLITVPMAAVMASLARQAGELAHDGRAGRDLPGYLGDDLPDRQEDEGGDGVIRVHTFYDAVRKTLKPGDIIVGETGTISMGLGFVRLPAGVRCEGQSLWGAIGWATPAAFGMAMAAPSQRVVLLTGEGSHQLTVQAVGEFARFGCRSLILVLNNEGFLIERLLCDDGERVYNDIAAWDYTLLARGFGCGDWQCERVITPDMLRDALARAGDRPDKGAYLEVIAPRYDAPPMARVMGRRAQAPQG